MHLQGGLEPHLMILQGETRELLFDTRKQLKGEVQISFHSDDPPPCDKSWFGAEDPNPKEFWISLGNLIENPLP